MNYINEYARAFLFEGGEEACLLIHGFTASPAQMRYLGEFLNRKGYTVRGICLAGHGRSLEDMEDSDWQDWWNSAKEEYQSLAKKFEKVYVMGLSMGGTLSLLLAQEYRVAKVVSIASPIKVHDKLAYLTPLLKYIRRFDPPISELDSQEEIRAKKDKYNVGYLTTPLSTVPSLLKLIKRAKKGLTKIEAPILVVQSRDDQTVVAKSAQIIYDRVSSFDKEILWLERSGHLVTLGEEKDILHKRILNFLEED